MAEKKERNEQTIKVKKTQKMRGGKEKEKK